ncbi:MAG: hypothetical protein R3C59_04565 [Planctomycetaceae bacterium]
MITTAFVLTLWTVGETSADEPRITLNHVRAVATRWRESFVNLRMVYELRSLPPLDEPLVDWAPPDVVESAPKFSESEWIWAEHGLDLLDGRAFYWTPAKPGGVRELDVFNGPDSIVFRANYKRSPDLVEAFTHLKIQPHGGGKPTSYKARTPMIGLRSPATAEWLPEMLSSGDWKLTGVEDILGHSCVKLTFDSSQSKSEVLWLDLQHDVLPRRHRLEAVSSSGSTSATDFVADEFQQLESGVWFPKRGRLQLLTNGPVQNQLFVVTEAQLNIPLDLTRFRPPEPGVGTVVFDGRTGRSSIHGNPETQPDTMSPQHAVRQIDVSAVPESVVKVGWVSGLMGVSVAALAIGLWLRKTASGR